MATSYTRKTPVELAFNANVKRLRAEIGILANALANETLAEMSDQFEAELHNGNILEIEGSREELRATLRRVAERELAEQEAPSAITG